MATNDFLIWVFSKNLPQLTKGVKVMTMPAAAINFREVPSGYPRADISRPSSTHFDHLSRNMLAACIREEEVGYRKWEIWSESG
jgi:hypothetical protein